jgi:hypothetical protein
LKIKPKKNFKKKSFYLECRLLHLLVVTISIRPFIILARKRPQHQLNDILFVLFEKKLFFVVLVGVSEESSFLPIYSLEF